jgi:hypothetical protein
MERVIGPSRKTRVLHKEIMLLEGRIRAGYVKRSSSSSPDSSPA